MQGECKAKTRRMQGEDKANARREEAIPWNGNKEKPRRGQGEDKERTRKMIENRGKSRRRLEA
jgi:hypothetical protein